MVRIKIYCEGLSEETFIKNILFPSFVEKQIYLTAIPCDGVSKYSRIRKDIRDLCREDTRAVVTTMLDYYGLPAETPGYREAPKEDVYQMVEFVERKIAEDISEENFYPNLLLHEYETLLFSNVDAFSFCDLNHRQMESLREISRCFPTPEHINNSPNTAPSKRILKICEDYDKVPDGYKIAENIGLHVMREKCRHFDAWLCYLENLQNC